MKARKRVITGVKRNARIPQLQTEVVGEEETMGGEMLKIEEGEMRFHHQDEGAKRICNHEEEGDQVGILPIEDDLTDLLKEEDDTTMTIVGIDIVMTSEVIDLVERDLGDLVVETINGVVIEAAIEVEEKIAVTIVVMTVAMIAEEMEDLVVLDADGDVRLCREYKPYFYYASRLSHKGYLLYHYLFLLFFNLDLSLKKAKQDAVNYVF